MLRRWAAGSLLEHEKLATVEPWYGAIYVIVEVGSRRSISEVDLGGRISVSEQKGFLSGGRYRSSSCAGGLPQVRLTWFASGLEAGMR